MPADPKTLPTAAAIVAAEKTPTPTPSTRGKTDPSAVRKFALVGGSRSFCLKSGERLVATPFNGVDCVYAETEEVLAQLLEAAAVGNAFELTDPAATAE